MSAYSLRLVLMERFNEPSDGPAPHSSIRSLPPLRAHNGMKMNQQWARRLGKSAAGRPFVQWTGIIVGINNRLDPDVLRKKLEVRMLICLALMQLVPMIETFNLVCSVPVAESVMMAV